uniref:Valine--tRNA ligase n=1 Tax=Cacopsylla melanoneura TaxID=428564 RepID=A0A8D8XQQ2_9HEMI
MSDQPEAIPDEAPVKTAKQLEKEAKKLEKLKKFQEKQTKIQQTKEVSKEKTEKKETKKKETKDEPIVYTGNTEPGEKKDVLGPLPSSYSPQYVEAAWYPWWQKQGFFKPEYGRKSIGEKNPKGKFVMVIPPPNVTGTLHLGHALTNAVEDSITRWHRMKGKTTLWNPGCDHAGIATQVVVEKKLWREEKKTRHEVGRDKFIEKVWEWKQEKGDRIYEQMKLMGSSLDWDRACFTMDPKLSRAVTEAFLILHEAGDIYRSERLVHWSCTLKSAISDIEVDKVELSGRTPLRVPGYPNPIEFGVLASFAYKLADGSGDEIVVATTRLETLFADVAVAVHPEDERYKAYVGKLLVHPFCDRKIPVVADSFVERDFGTGAVKISPGHDHNDYEVAQRLGLPLITVLNEEGVIIGDYGEFSGMKRFDARIRVTEVLTEKGLYRGTESHAMVVPLCSRSKDIVEPLLKPQWYVRTGDMAAKAVQAVKTGELKIIPDHHTKTWYSWLENNRDWCISRQLWWGHRIPAYKVTFCDPAKQPKDITESDLWVSARSGEEAESKATAKFQVTKSEIVLKQDEDVLDTWFSSGLFPFSVFGWPDKTPELEAFYPGELLETGHDILFFWVARMVFFGQRLLGKLPFKEVFLHPIVRDAHGRKMSKSLGNVIDPLDVVTGISLEGLQARLMQDSNLDPAERERAAEGQKRDYPQGIPECGTDALRFALASYMTQGRDINLDILRVQGYRFFCNKIWNAARFSLSIVSSLLCSLDLSLATNSYLCANPTQESLEPSLDGGRLSVVDLLFHAMLSDRVTASYTHLKRWSDHVEKLLANQEDAVVKAAQAEVSSSKPSPMDAWILSRLADAVATCNKAFSKYEFNTITTACYNLWLYELCDVYLECIKPVMGPAGSLLDKAHAARTLLTVLNVGLRLLSPFMPFLSEELYQRLPSPNLAPSITVAAYPEQEEFDPLKNVSLEQDFELVQKIYTSIRSVRSDYQVVKSQKTQVFIDCLDSRVCTMIQSFALPIRTLAYCSDILYNPTVPPPSCATAVVSEKVGIRVSLEGLIKVDKEIERLNKKEDYLKQVIGKLKDQAAAEDYEVKVPETVRTANADKLKEAEGELSRLPAALEALKLMQ